MAEYIEREAVLQKIKKLQETDPATVGKKQFADGYFLGLDEAELIAMQATAADVVKVVRCINCDNMGFITGLSGSSNCYCAVHQKKVNEYDFCSYGEREAP